MKKWEEMANLPQHFRERTERLERNFTVSAVVFKKYEPLFQEIFKYPQEEQPRQPRGRKQRYVFILFVGSTHMSVWATVLIPWFLSCSLFC